ncbi:MAG: GNAT family N-acetyltransferase [Sandaracinaceae bacterium]|nr:GNAT family N-acetyltransferase [Myxococcales bacterium]MCB9630423.1 GNAT family N-acetyltransferase [Sandaracinaceae bacterium]
MARSPHDVTLRPLRDEDWPFLLALYASTREEELAPVPWPAAQKAEFLRSQFAAQRQHYDEHYADASREVVLVSGERAGRLYLDRRADEIRIVDIALIPALRGQGVGTRLLTAVLEEAAQSGRDVRIHVETFNPAMRLYLRLGFEKLEERGVYWLMGWRPAPRGQQDGEQGTTDARDSER